MGYLRVPIASLAALILLGGVSAGHQQAPGGLAPETLEYLQRAPDLRQARLRLIGLRNSGQIDQAEMMKLARWLDQDLRGKFMNDLGVIDAVDKGAPRSPFPERSGSSPVRGRGVFSDEDVLAKNAKQLETMLGAARERGYTIRQNRFNAYIPELDTVVWKPGRQPASLSSPGSFLDDALARSLDPDFALGAKPNEVAHPLESVLENITKGQEALFDPLLPSAYDEMPETQRFPHRVDAELELVAGAKDVVRSLDAAGLRDRFPLEYERLDAFRRMDKSFADSGLGSFDKAQELMRRLMGAAYESAEAQLNGEVEAIERGLRSADISVRSEMLARARELRERLVRMATRFETLSDQHPEAMQRFSGRRTAAFWAEQTDRVRRLSPLMGEAADKLLGQVPGGRTAASAGAEAPRTGDSPETVTGRARALSITVDALQFAQCLAEGRDKTACIQDALAGYVIGELVSQGIGFVALVSPTGGLIATAGLAGVGLYMASAQVYTGYLEYAAYREAVEREAVASAAGAAARRRRVPELAARLDAFEARVAAAVKAATRRSATVLAELDALEAVRSEIEAGSSDEAALEELAAAIDIALQPCFRLRDITQRVNPYVLQAEQAGEAAEAQLRRAVELAGSCSGSADLGNAVDAERSAQRSRQEIAQLEVILGSDLDDARAAAREMQDALGGDAQGQLTRASSLIDAADDAAQRARDYRERVAHFSDAVAAANEETEFSREALRVEYRMFLAAFPDDLTKMLDKGTVRLGGIRAGIESMAGLQPSEWTDRLAAFGDTSAPTESSIQLAASIKRRDLPFRIDHLRECTDGGDFDAVALIDRIDTAGTVVDLAIAMLGAGYEEEREACEARLAAAASAPAGVPAAATGASEPSNGAGRTSTSEADRTSTSEADRAARLLERIAGWQERLDCLEAGVQRFPNKDLDCNVHFTMGTRQKNIDDMRRLIREAQLSLGMEPTVPSPVGTTGPGRESDPGGGREGDTGGVRVGSLAAGLLLTEMVVGDVRYYFDSAEQQHQLSPSDSIPSGATVDSGSSASATLRFPSGARVSVGAATRVRVDGLGDGRAPRLHLSHGSVQVQEADVGAAEPKKTTLAAPTAAVAPSGSTGRVRVTTPHLELSPVGTRYRVSTSAMRTDVEVFEGTVRLRGSMLARGPDRNGNQGKPGFTQSLELRAGQRGFGVGVAPDVGKSPHAPVTPGWLGVPRPAQPAGQGTSTNAEPGSAGGSVNPRGDSVPASGVPAWLNSRRAPAPAGPLARSDPWNDSQVQALIDEWLRRATPTVAATQPGPVRYSEWGQVVGPGTVYAGTPDHPAGWSRYRALWEVRDRYTSLNLCTLGEFVRRRLDGTSLDDCATIARADEALADRQSVGAGSRDAPREVPAEERRSTAGGPLPGIFGVLDAVPAGQWINGKPDLHGRNELTVLILAPEAPDYLDFRACVERAEAQRASYEATGGILIGTSDARLWPTKKGTARERLAEWIDSQGLRFPVAFENRIDPERSTADPVLKNVTVVIDATGAITDIRTCGTGDAKRR